MFSLVAMIVESWKIEVAHIYYSASSRFYTVGGAVFVLTRFLEFNDEEQLPKKYLSMLLYFFTNLFLVDFNKALTLACYFNAIIVM